MAVLLFRWEAGGVSLISPVLAAPQLYKLVNAVRVPRSLWANGVVWVGFFLVFIFFLLCFLLSSSLCPSLELGYDNRFGIDMKVV